MIGAVDSGARPETVSPSTRLAFTRVSDAPSAEELTRRLTHGHYENFSVVSLLLPRHLRQDFCNVYSFCRTADDLGDEVHDRERARELLEQFEQQTHACFAGEAQSAVFVALAETIRRHDLPIQPFLDLISAFKQDQDVTRYDTFEQLMDYCRRSADPVGRLVLYLCGYRDDIRQRLSDRTCSALQLANFWQDVRRDLLDHDRVYLPRESMEGFGVTEEQIREGRCDDNYRRLIKFEVERTAAMFDEGDALLPTLDSSVRRQVALFGRGGRAVLTAIRRQEYDTLSRRPTLSRWTKGRLMMGVLAEFVGRSITSPLRRANGERA